MVKFKFFSAVEAALRIEMIADRRVNSNEFLRGWHEQEADHCTISFIEAKAAVAISRNQYVCGWRVQWGSALLVLKIYLKINLLSIVLAEGVGLTPNSLSS